MSEVERIFSACDVSNIWRGCKDQYGPVARVDFQVLGEIIPASRYPACVCQRLVAYLVTNRQKKHQALYAALRGYGYAVKERFMRYDKSAGKPTRTDWDVGITIDAVSCMHEYDTFVLMSGDGDFSQLLEFLKENGKQTTVLTFAASASRQLYDAADQVIFLDESALFQQK